MKKTPEFLSLDTHTCFRLYLASKSIIQAYSVHLKTLDLTYPQYLVMMVLWESEPLSVKDLGARLYLDSGTLSPLLKKLQEKNYVDKVRSSEDERSVLVSLTVTGKKLKDKTVQVQSTMRSAVCFTDESLGELNTMLDDFTASIQQN